MSKFLQISICTFNRVRILEKNLEVLLPVAEKHPTYPEILVIDNNSTDQTAELIKKLQERYPKLLAYFFEKQQGLSFARNRAIRESSSVWLAYLDDDARVHTDWLENACEVAEQDDFDCFGGPFFDWHLYGPPPSWFQASKPRQEHYGLLRPGLYPSGGNFFCKREFLLKVGGFPTKLGMRKGKCGYGEEDFLCKALRTKGARIGFAPQVRIDHCVLPFKYSLWWQFGSAYAKGRDSWKIDSRTPHVLKALELFFSIPFMALRDTARGCVFLAEKKHFTAAGILHYVGTRLSYRLGKAHGVFLQWYE